jgi:hypothetical protein
MGGVVQRPGECLTTEEYAQYNEIHQVPKIPDPIKSKPSIKIATIITGIRDMLSMTIADNE